MFLKEFKYELEKVLNDLIQANCTQMNMIHKNKLRID